MLRAMALRILPSLRSLLAVALLALAGCGASAPPFAQLSGLILAPRLDEISGMATSRAHDGTLWVANDGGNTADLYAIGPRGGLQATLHVAGVVNTDWEDLAAFDLDGRHYILIADTGDNGGLRKTLQLHVVEEPRSLTDGTVRPAWSIAFRWPDGPRDCEAVAVDAARGEILLISKRRQPPEVWSLPLRPQHRGLLVAEGLRRLAFRNPTQKRCGRMRARLASTTRSPPPTCRPTDARWPCSRTAMSCSIGDTGRRPGPARWPALRRFTHCRGCRKLKPFPGPCPAMRCSPPANTARRRCCTSIRASIPLADRPRRESIPFVSSRLS